jgi:hypothetical protein
MTVLGKIVAFVNVILSLGVGALIVANYVARTNWHNAYLESEKNVKAAQENARASDLAREQIDGELKQVKAQLAAKEKDSADKAQDFSSQMKAQTDKLEKQVAALKEQLATAGAAAAELQRLHQEVDYLKGLVAQRDTQLRDSEKQKEDYRNAAVQAKIEAQAEQERNNGLNLELERLTKLLQRVPTAPTVAGAPPIERPPQDVEGVVKKVDASSGLVSISIGSDAGIAKGNTLEAYRLTPEPKYLGMLQVLEVRPDQAVCKPFTKSMGRLQAGDRVASNINRK